MRSYLGAARRAGPLTFRGQTRLCRNARDEASLQRRRLTGNDTRRWSTSASQKRRRQPLTEPSASSRRQPGVHERSSACRDRRRGPLRIGHLLIGHLRVGISSVDARDEGTNTTVFREPRARLLARMRRCNVVPCRALHPARLASSRARSATGPRPRSDVAPCRTLHVTASSSCDASYAPWLEASCEASNSRNPSAAASKRARGLVA